ncbi:MAG: GIY-YIG nuclease family protein [bacterium]|nr:GIY-YIG nuclease family protein [bacterium]
MWVIYILLNKDYNQTYVGSTNNFNQRLIKHNRGLVLSTKNQKPWIPIYLEFYPNEISARQREKELKTSTGRRYLKKVINNIIQTWAFSSVG